MVINVVKAKKGTVSVDSNRGWLRIRFRHQGQPYSFAVGLPDTPVNRKVAQGKAQIIELDIQSGHFDVTLERYKPPKQAPGYVEGRLTVVALFEQFMEHKANHVTPKTMEKYKATLGYLNKFFVGKPVDFFTSEDAENFVEWQKKQKHPSNNRLLSPTQIKKVLHSRKRLVQGPLSKGAIFV